MDNKEILKNIKEIESKYKIINKIQKDMGQFLNYELFMPFILDHLTIDMKYFSYNYNVIDEDGKMTLTFLNKPAIVFDLEKRKVYINDLEFIRKRLNEEIEITNNKLIELKEENPDMYRLKKAFIKEFNTLLDKTNYDYCAHKIVKKVNELNNNYGIDLKFTKLN